MLVDFISHNESGYFSKLMLDYLNEEEAIKPLYHRFASIENFKEQLIEKQSNFSEQKREQLIIALKKQYSNKNISEATQKNIDKLALANTFTITTGHQLNLFSGPVYYIYKILSVINLAESLKTEYPEYNFVPVFWMATEDHDFEEINHFNFRDKKIQWQSNQTGPVGKFETEGLDKINDLISIIFGKGEKAQKLKDLFSESYIKNNTLTAATFHLTNELFKNYGIVIVNGDDVILKNSFKEVAKKELFDQALNTNITQTKQYLKNYFVQVNPREINLFYIDKGIRERIVKDNDQYKVLNTNYSFTASEIMKLIDEAPEKFSPNAILRPLYQETILPNLAYVGGGGELAYWLELKSSFDAFNTTFPILIHRDSVVLVSEKIDQKIQNLNISYAELFLNNTELTKLKVKQYSSNLLDFKKLKTQLANQFDALKIVAEKTDKSFKNALDAQYTKQIKGLDNLEKKLIRAEKLQLNDKIQRVLNLKEELFPGESLQERKQNFAEFYIDSEINLIETIKKEINPLKSGFKIIKI